MKVQGKFSYGWDGFASVSGHISLGMLGSKFNAEGGVEACLEFVDFCRGVNALISSKGMAVCMVIDYEIDDWRPGFGYRWGDSMPDAYFSGCSLGPYRETIKRASAAAVADERSVVLPSGLPGTVIAARGVSSAPRITLVGPRGERVSSPVDGGAFQDKRFLLLPNAGAKLTQVAISHPSGGRWRVIVEDGTPLESLKVAHGVEAPRISASVTGTGQEKTLRYRVEQRPGQTVSFIERGPSVSGTIGTARDSKGTLRFTPAGGVAERREIVALVEQDGLATEQVVVARYARPVRAEARHGQPPARAAPPRRPHGDLARRDRRPSPPRHRGVVRRPPHRPSGQRHPHRRARRPPPRPGQGHGPRPPRRRRRRPGEARARPVGKG